MFKQYLVFCEKPVLIWMESTPTISLRPTSFGGAPALEGLGLLNFSHTEHLRLRAISKTWDDALLLFKILMKRSCPGWPRPSCALLTNAGSDKGWLPGNAKFFNSLRKYSWLKLVLGNIDVLAAKNWQWDNVYRGFWIEPFLPLAQMYSQQRFDFTYKQS